MEEKKETKWNQIEEYFATQVVEQAKRATKRWFIAWLITMIALVVTNVYWITMMNSYEYVYQDSEGMNNINTVGNSSPLVVQYINSYGQDGMPSMSQPRSEVQTQASAPQQQTQPVGQVPYQYPPYGYPYPPMFGYYGPAQDNSKNAPLTKEDLKEVVNSAIASIKEEMASKQKEEALSLKNIFREEFLH